MSIPHNKQIFEEIDKVLRDTRGHQMSKEQYTHIANQLGNKNFLVFGTGYDSDLWRLANLNGRTLFLENLKEWIPEDATDVILVKYSTKISEYKELLQKPDKLYLKLPKEVEDICWDVILVDSPTGYTRSCPGRMQSIYTASKLAKDNTLIYVHDCDRKVEGLYTDAYLKVLRQVGNLRECKLLGMQSL